MAKERFMAIVTGASGGIGSAVVRRMADDTRFVFALSDLPSKFNELSAVADELAHNRCVTLDGLDLTDPDDSKLERFADSAFSVDCDRYILANIAGMEQKFAPAVRMDMENARRVLEVNLVGTLRMCRAVLPRMRAKGSGRIVNISSIAAQHADGGNAAYAISKAGVESLTRTLAREATQNKSGPRHQICVNAVAPGIINTPMAQLLSVNVLNEYGKNCAFERLGEPEEIAEVIYWLATSAPVYLTGEIIRVDGGYLA